MKSKLELIFILTAVIFSFTLLGNSKAQQANQAQEGIGTFDELRELTQGNELGANMEELAQQQPANQSAQQQPANQSAQQQPANQSAQQQPANQSAQQQPANQSAQQQPANQSAQQQPANQSAQQQPANQSANFTQTRDNIFETIMKYLEGNSSQN